VRLSANEMSRVLSAHAAGLLVPGGADDGDEPRPPDGVGCALQVAKRERTHILGSDDGRWLLATRFDSYYRDNMTPEELIALLDAPSAVHR
jgi:hypothetical protein